MPRRGLVVLISDLYYDAAELLSALDHFRHFGHDVLVFHVLAPLERRMPIDGAVKLVDAETGEAPGNAGPRNPRQLHHGRRQVAGRDPQRLPGPRHRPCRARPPTSRSDRPCSDYLMQAVQVLLQKRAYGRLSFIQPGFLAAGLAVALPL